MNLMGLVVTLPDKSVDDTFRYFNILDVEFLKRKWRWCDEVKAYVAPIAIKSILRSLSWMSETDITPLEHLYDVLDAAQRSLFSHGRSVYDEYIAKLRIALSPDYADIDYTLHSFDYWVTFYEPKYQSKNIEYK